MLGACGKKVGKFTGPHLVKFNERLVVNGQDIDDAAFARIATTVFGQSQEFGLRHGELGALTWFEFLTAMAVEYFNQEKVDFAVFEVGLGGRFDATNILENVLVSTITNVDLDHMHLLGDTVEKIAFEKAGIIKKAPLVTAAGGAALAVLEEKCRSRAVPMIVLHNPDGDFAPALFRDFYVTIQNASEQFCLLMQARIELLQNQLFGQDALPLSGAYQRLNALTAVVSLCVTEFFAEQLRLHQEQFLNDLARGLIEAYWPGRYEIVPDRKQILDGAHNPHGARALRLSLEDMFGLCNFVFIFASFQNKDAKSLLQELVRPGDYVLAPRLRGERAFHDVSDIEAICRDLQVNCATLDSFAQAAQLAGRLIAEAETTSRQPAFAPITVVTGSFATVREAKGASL